MDLRQEFDLLKKELEEIKRLISENVKPKQVINEEEKLLTVKETAEFLDLTVPTIYSKISKNELPFMKRGSRVYFSKKDLLEFYKKARAKTIDEIDYEAENYLSNKLRILKKKYKSNKSIRLEKEIISIEKKLNKT